MKKLFMVLIFTVLFFCFFLEGLTYYNFLTPESNFTLERIKEKFREKEIVLEMVVLVTVATDDVLFEDWLSMSIPDPNNSKIGDTFRGPSGTTYVLIPPTRDQEKEWEKYNLIGQWAVKEEDG